MIAPPTEFALNGQLPVRVAEPADAAGVANALAAANESGQAVIVFGGGTLQSLGNHPRRYDVALSVRRLDRLLQYHPRDLTMSVEAGMTVAGLSAIVAPERQFIPFDVPNADRATVGGTLAAGWCGPRRLAYGSLRDLLIGSAIALTDGTVAAAGGMVVKNVSGYDMSKLYIGSLGTLGAIVRANFKTIPVPTAERLALAALSEKSRERAIAALDDLTLEPTAALVVHGFFESAPRVADEATRLLVLFEGSAAAIHRATRDLRALLGKCGVPETQLYDGSAAQVAFTNAIDAYTTPREDRSITFRSTGLPATAWSRALTAQSIAREGGVSCDVIADVRTGDTILRIAGVSARHAIERLSEIHARLRRAVNPVYVLAGAPSLRRVVDAWGGCVPTTIDTLRTMKARFDPQETLAPGRYVGGI